MDNNNIGDFAANILAQDRGNAPVAMPLPVNNQDIPESFANTPDISNIVVPTSFISGVVTEGKAPEVEEEAVPVVVKEVQDTSELRSLIEEVKTLLSEVKQVLTEVTAVGAGIGAPAASSQKKVSKDDDSMEDALSKILRKRARKS
jgi:hypothetical protein